MAQEEDFIDLHLATENVEHVEECTAAPSCRIRGIIKSQILADTNQTETSDSDDRGSSRSPPPNCAICLGKCENKCFTDSCLHQFCFACLMEWSKIKAECPLCKQHFKSIIHNVKSIDQFDEFIVRPTPRPHDPVPPSGPGSSFGELFPLNILVGRLPRYRFSTTLQVGPRQREAIHQLFLHNSVLTERYSREYATDLIPYRQHGQEWRRYIYERRLYALPLADITGRVRDCNLQFYRTNPAQVHRLMPWINRELVALLCGNAYQIDIIMDFLPLLFQRHDIASEGFKEYFQSYCRAQTNHFIHELLNFAKSPYDMIGYDREVQYTPYFETDIIAGPIELSSDSEPETESEEVIDVIDLDDIIEPNNTQFTIETRTPTSTTIMSGSINPSNLEQIPVQSTAALPQSSQELQQLQPTTSTAINDITVNYNVNVDITNEPSTSSSTSQNNIITIPSTSTMQNSVESQDSNALRNHSTNNDNRNEIYKLTSDSDSECQFVLARKPPHLRTPELVSLNSDSDSDIVFVDETVLPKPLNSEATTDSQFLEETKLNIQKNLMRGIFEPTIYTDSTSSADELKIIIAKQPDNLFNMNQPSTSRGENRLLCKENETKYEAAPYKYYIKKRTRAQRNITDSTTSESESSHEEFKINNQINNKKRKIPLRKNRPKVKTTKKKTKTKKLVKNVSEVGPRINKRKNNRKQFLMKLIDAKENDNVGNQCDNYNSTSSDRESESSNSE